MIPRRGSSRRSPQIYTTKGIHIGSSEEEFLAAYGDAATRDGEASSYRFYSVDGDGTSLNFAFPQSGVDENLEGTPVVGTLENMYVYLDDTGIPGGALQSQCSD